MGNLLILLMASIVFAKSEGQALFESQCLRCHTEKSQKPVSLLKQKYKGKPQEVAELAKRCPWGKGLSDMEVELVSKWLAGLE